MKSVPRWYKKVLLVNFKLLPPKLPQVALCLKFASEATDYSPKGIKISNNQVNQVMCPDSRVIKLVSFVTGVTFILYIVGTK